MKTKNMRKKALLASVAMLLVAVVALGGATYAWFTTNSSVIAQGVNLTSAKAANLFLNTNKDANAQPAGTEEDPAWAETITLASPTTTLQPNSSNDGSEFYRISSLDSDGAGNYTVKEISKDTTGVATIEFAIMAGKDNTRVALDSIGVNSDASNVNMYSSLRVAVKIGNNATKVYSPSNTNVWAIDSAVLTGGDTEKYLGTSTLAQFYNHDSSIQGVVFAQPTLANSTDALTDGANALMANTPQVVTIKVWMEGQDQNADNRAIDKAVEGLTFSFTDLSAS